MAKKRSGAEVVFEVPVSFGTVSIGDRTARIGISVDRQFLKVSRADQVLCGHRLTGKLIAGQNGDTEGQNTLVNDFDPELTGTFDVKSFSASPKAISCGLTFNLEDIDVSNMAHFAKRVGKVVVDGVEELPEGSEDESEE